MDEYLNIVADINDTLVCSACDSSYVVTQAWLDANVPESSHNGKDVVRYISGALLKKIPCVKCGSKSYIAVRRKRSPSVATTHDTGVCPACSGNGGRCTKCTNGIPDT